MNKNTKTAPASCPCESGKSYDFCCRPYVDQLKNAPTAEALMRSRYSAFVVGNEDYLRYSWHPDHCPADIRLNGNTRWLGLKINSTKAGSENDNNGEVTFVARSKSSGRAHRLVETSRFTRFENRWVYLDGKQPD